MNRLSHQNRKVRHIALVLVCLFATMQGGSYVFAQAASSVAKEAAMVQPFITETTVLIVKVDPKRIALPNLPDSVKAMFPGGRDGYVRWAQNVTKGFDRLREVTEGHVTYGTIGIPLSKSEWSAFLFMKETSAQSQKQFTGLLASLHETQSSTRDGITVVMPAHDTDVEARLNAIVPSVREELVNAFDAVKDYPIQVLLLPPEYVRRSVVELMPALPRQLGGGPSSLLTNGLVWASLGIDIAGPRVELVVQSSSEQAARDLSEYLPKMLLGTYDGLANVKAKIPRDKFQGLLPLIKPTVKGDRIAIWLDDPKVMSEVLRLVSRAPAAVGERLRRRENSDKFKQILLGMHSYHNAYKSFPPRDEVRNAEGKTGLSWRVHILPFIEEQKLYEEFALDEPWDSPQNKPLIEKMPKIYKSRGLDIKPGHTAFLAPLGEDTIFGGQKPIKFHNITDGTSNTVTLVEVKPGLCVPWTAPQDYAFDPELPGTGLRVSADGRFLAALADGSVQNLRGNIAAEVMLQLFQMSDGRPLNWGDVR